jgi:hypothetical protein
MKNGNTSAYISDEKTESGETNERLSWPMKIKMMGLPGRGKKVDSPAFP